MFGFPHQRKADFQFNRNFLKSIIFQFDYHENKKIVANKKFIDEILLGKFPNNQDFMEGKLEFQLNDKTHFPPTFQVEKPQVKGITYTNKEQSRTINITDKFISYIIAGHNYKNFEEVQNEMFNEFKPVFERCEITAFTRIATRKINLLQYRIKEDISAIESLNLIFNKNLVSSFVSLPNKKNVIRGVSTINFKNDDYSLNLSYGLLPKKNESENAILDIDLILNKDKILYEDALNELRKINSEIFNIFIWGFQESLINTLNN